MSDRCARITLVLALVPLVIGTWWVVVSADHGLHIPSIVGTVLAIVLTVLIWRRYVRWTVLRSTSTAGLALLTVAQVLLWHPLWAIGGCGLDDSLCTGQSLSCAGIALAAFALLWWRALLTGRGWRSAEPGMRRFTMTPNAVRLAIGIALIPLLPGLFWIGFLALDDLGWGSSNELRVWLCYEACAVFATGVWLLLWRSAVVWSRSRRVITLLLAAVLLASPVSVFWMGRFASGPFDETWRLLCALSPVFAYALWLAGTAWAWRTDRTPTAAGLPIPAAPEDVARCPTCSYSLRGLHEVRCPECGWASTVDDIVQRSMESVLPVP